MKLSVFAAALSLSTPAFAAATAVKVTKDTVLCACVEKGFGIQPNWRTESPFVNGITVDACTNGSDYASGKYSPRTPIGSLVEADSSTLKELPKDKRYYCAIKKGNSPDGPSYLEIFLNNCTQPSQEGEKLYTTVCYNSPEYEDIIKSLSP